MSPSIKSLWKFRSQSSIANTSKESLLNLRYWHQRHMIYSKYDEGIWMTDDAWFGITPEPVAK